VIQTLKTAVSLLSILVLFAAGCGIKPQPVQRSISADEAVRRITMQNENILDFTGSATVTTRSENGSGEKFGLTIKYMKPDRFRFMVKGFAGLPLAVITLKADSLIAYFPQDNSYIKSASGAKVISRLVPGLNLDISKLTSFLTGILPDNEVADFQKSIIVDGGTSVLMLKKEPFEHVLTLSGEHFDLIEERFLFAGETSWLRTASAYRDFDDGIRFPRTITMERAGDMISFDFSRREFNTGLKSDKLIFTVPFSAEKLSIPGLE